MAQVSRSVALAATPEAVWAAVGEFQGLANWHPAVARSTAETIDGVEHRVLTLADDAVIVEKFLGAGAMSYGYEITEPGPLPVADYRSVLTVAPAGDGAVVVWCSTFTGTADGAQDAIAGVYEAGLDALAKTFEP